MDADFIKYLISQAPSFVGFIVCVAVETYIIFRLLKHHEAMHKPKDDNEVEE